MSKTRCLAIYFPLLSKDDKVCFECLEKNLKDISPYFVAVSSNVFILPVSLVIRRFVSEMLLVDKLKEAILKCRDYLLENISKVVALKSVKIGVCDGMWASFVSAQLSSSTYYQDQSLEISLKIIDSCDFEDFINSFPIAWMPNKKIVDTLKKIGIRNLGEFKRLGIEAISDRFGKEGEHCFLLAKDGGGYPIIQSFEDVYEKQAYLEPPCNEKSQLIFLFNYLFKELMCDLSNKGLTTNFVELFMSCDLNEFKFNWFNEYPFTDAWITKKLVTFFSSFQSKAPINFVKVIAKKVYKEGFFQGELWTPISSSDSGLLNALSRVELLNGEGTVFFAVKSNGRIPEEQSRLVKFSELQNHGKTVLGFQEELFKELSQPWPGKLLMPTPSILLKEKPEIKLLSSSQTEVLVGGRGNLKNLPKYVEIVLNNKTQVFKVDYFLGPWPFELHWWDARFKVRKAYMIIQLHKGYKILVSVSMQKWILEGIYD